MSTVRLAHGLSYCNKVEYAGSYLCILSSELLNYSINPSNLVFVKHRLNKVLTDASYEIGLHKKPGLKTRLELFATNTTLLEMKWQQHVPNPGCHDTETARTITCGPSTWHNHATIVSRAKPGTKGNGDDR